MGWIISVSGSDGAGKSTLINNLIARLASSGKPVKFYRVRLGFTPVMEWLKKTAGMNEANASPADTSSDAALPKEQSFLKRAVSHVYRLGSLLDLIGLLAWVALLRAAGKRVVTERYLWDNQIIYREKYGEPGWLARALWAIIRLAAARPDAAFMLEIPPGESYRRVLARTDGVAEESLEVLAYRARLYAELAQPRLIIIDAMQPAEKVFEQVWTEAADLVAE